MYNKEMFLLNNMAERESRMQLFKKIAVVIMTQLFLKLKLILPAARLHCSL